MKLKLANTVLEDYIQMLLQLITLSPDILFLSSTFPLAFRCAMTGLTVVHSDIVFASLDLFRTILTHDCMEPASPSTPAKHPLYAGAIREAMNKEGLSFVACIMNGLVGDFPEDASSTVITIIRALVTAWSNQILLWLPPVLDQLPVTSVPNESKALFLREVTR